MDITLFDGPFHFLSNFHPCRVTYDGLEFLNSEAAYQAAKCAAESHKLWFTKLNAADSKKLGRQVRMRDDWEEVKVSAMCGIVRAKFAQNPELRARLLATDGHLEEGNTWGDTTWGTVNGEGKNLLGQILMLVRSELS